MEVDEKEAGEEATTAATAAAAAAAAAVAAASQEEENSGNDDSSADDDRERLTEALEWLGLAASLSSPSVTLLEESRREGEEGETSGRRGRGEGEEREGEREEAGSVVDVCSFEGLLGSGFAARALEAAAAAVAGAEGDHLPWAALVLVGFPDSPLSWTRGSLPKAAAETTAKKRKKKEKKETNSSSWTPEPVRLGPEACREHALFVIVVRGGEEGASSGCRCIAAVASGGGDGFDSRLL